MKEFNVNTDSITTNIAYGMTDSELEHLCENRHNGVAPWVYWTSELYSLGKCIRYWTRYPISMPLFVYSDHGVSLASHLAKHELENSARIHLTWNPIKAERNKNIDEKNVIHIPHPWITYRRKLGIERISRPSGTLVFFMHGTSSVKWKGNDSEEYFDTLRKLPEECQPVVMCLHMHDINAGLHKKLRRYGFPIVTAGNTSSVNFVDRFYDLIKNYAYVAAQDWGSYVAYCVELGVPFFLVGKKPILVNCSDENIPFGEHPEYIDSYHKEMKTKFEILFRDRVNDVTLEQRSFVKNILGLGSNVSNKEVQRLLWVELIYSWNRWNVVFYGLLKGLLFKLGIFEKLRLLRSKAGVALSETNK